MNNTKTESARGGVGSRSKWTQAYCDLANALREFERAHAIWMNTSVFTEEGKRAKQEKDRTMKIYMEAYEAHERSKRETVEECH